MEKFKKELTEQKLLSNVKIGRTLPVEIQNIKNNEKHKKMYYVKCTNYYISDYNNDNKHVIRDWIVNDKIFSDRKKALELMNSCQRYSESFGEIYEDKLGEKGEIISSNKMYLINKLSYLNINLSYLEIDMNTLYKPELNKYSNISKEERLSISNEYEKLLKKKCSFINKRIKEYNKFHKNHKDKLSYGEFYYIMSYFRYHPDFKYPYNVSDFYVNYTVEEINFHDEY